MPIVDIRRLANQSTIEPADLCIIGAGAAGITLATELAGTPHKVYMLESGGLDFDVNTQDLYVAENTGLDYDLEGSRLRYFGGTTNHWSGWCSKFNKEDFKQREWIPHSGWPINHKDLWPYHKRTSRMLDLPSQRFHAAKLYPKKQALLKNDLTSGMWRFSSPTRFGEKYRKRIDESPNITTFLHANVTNIKAANNLKSIDSVEVKTLDGKEFRISAKYFILACGGLENPRLLLASNTQTEAGIGNQNDLVGRFFMEHPHLLDVAKVYHAQKKHSLFRFSNSDRGVVVNMLLNEALRQKERLVQAAFSIEHTIEHSPQKSDEETLKHIQEISFLSTPLSHQSTINIRMEQSPNANSRVTLNNKRNALNQPGISLNWYVQHDDYRAAKVGIRLISQLYMQHSFGVVKLSKDFEQFTRGKNPIVEGGYHHMGTTRMSSDPKQGVVDKHCKVHGINNLYIAGSSVFPTSGWANPTYTIVALALRLSKHLKKKMA